MSTWSVVWRNVDYTSISRIFPLPFLLCVLFCLCVNMAFAATWKTSNGNALDIMTHHEFHSCSVVRIDKSKKVWLAESWVYVGVTVNMYRIFVENVESNKPLVKYRHKCVIIFKWIFKKLGMKMWAGFVWLGIGSRGVLLWTRWLTFRHRASYM